MKFEKLKTGNVSEIEKSIREGKLIFREGAKKFIEEAN